MKAKFIELGIEDLEERIAPGVPTLVTPGGNVVSGPVEASGGATNAFTQVSAHTTAPGDAGLSFDFVC